MNFQRNRLILLLCLSFVATWIYATWSQEKMISQAVSPNQQITSVENNEIPATLASSPSHAIETPTSSPVQLSELIDIETDVMKLKIDCIGGDINFLQLSKFPQTRNGEQRDFKLFDTSLERYYVAQSGLASTLGPDSAKLGRTAYKLLSPNLKLADGQNKLVIDLGATLSNNVEIIKRFTFERSHYDIQVTYIINNTSDTEYVGQFYARLKQRPPQEKKGAFLGVQTFRGMATYTVDKPYTKITFKEIKDKTINKNVKGGWTAMIEQYFLSAWIPGDGNNAVSARYLDQDTAMIETLMPAVHVAPHSQSEVSAKLYAGPQVTEVLETLSPGLQLTVDYGLLWPVCQPIFWLLKQIQSLVHNWGLAIILVTVTIKLLFFKLSASSYRSMGKMRKLQPKIADMKAQYGSDQAKFGQAMLELYRREKVNPLGGCLPLIIQIPVFIALYYVLLGSVELHNAPFFGWIQDLSAKDPLYILPVIMGITMFAQQKLSPAPPDPVQAKVMLFMPLLFTGLFFNFPAGLVLYWVVNNLLSITQQWYITRSIDADSAPRVRP